ncbi:right-handed parallel beta-helix repeat-containing protein [Microbulbifer sp. CNSA002]|uniref:right-handed parallel beta-helix repeat-containing protein n=1 Tax=Microbulbifer sp. CNSA002 TaxID=3373604 RepID=UPI0039B602EA
MKLSVNMVLPVCAAILASNVLAVECGDTIDTATVLTEDLVCVIGEDDEYALRVVGPTGVLNLGGYSVTCVIDVFDATGIVVEGFSALVSNGTISGCDDGIFLGGTGIHNITGVDIVDFEGDGITIESDNNSILGNQIVGRGLSIGGQGIDLEGSNCIVSQNNIADVGDRGIESLGNFNTLNNNTIDNTDRDAIWVRGDNSYVFGNVLTNSQENGVALSGDSNQVISNVISGSEESGINIDGGSNNFVIGNSALNNLGNSGDFPGGIVISSEESENNSIFSNTAIGNNEFDLRDVFDSGNCDSSNSWSGNIFVTADPACLD